MARAGRQPAGPARVDNPVRQRRGHEIEPAGPRRLPLRPPGHAHPMGAGRSADRARARRRGYGALLLRPGGDHDRAVRRSVARRRAARSRQCLRPDAQVLRHDPQAVRGRDALLRPARHPRGGRADPRDPARKPGLADHGDPGRAGDLRNGARAWHRHPDRQYLGDPPALPGDRGRQSTSASSRRPNMSAAMPM